MKNVILDLCGGTGSWSKPYKENGFIVYNITLPDFDIMVTDYTSTQFRFRQSLLDGIKLSVNIEEVFGVLAAPPCTEFSIAKDHKLERNTDAGWIVVEQCLQIIKRCNPIFWAIENPTGYLRKYLGKPKFSFQPYEFGDAWTKRTDLWGYFNAPQKIYKKYSDVPKIEGLYKRPGRKTVSLAFNHVNHKKYIQSFDGLDIKTDADFRAVTPPKFALSFFEANH